MVVHQSLRCQNSIFIITCQQLHIALKKEADLHPALADYIHQAHDLGSSKTQNAPEWCTRDEPEWHI